MNPLTITSGNEINVPNKLLPSEHEMMVFTTISKQAADSKMYKHYGDQAGIMMTILAARELGVPPMLALNGGISNIQGKLEISARLMNAMMRRAGVKIAIQESTDDRCVLVGTRSDTGDVATVSYSVADAQKAGLVKTGGGWTRNPKDMCFARAISRLARQIAPDVIGGCYVEGEIKASEAEIDVPKNIPYEQPVVKHDEAESEVDKLNRVLDMFDMADRDLVLEYMNAVMHHFGWSQAECLKKFIEEKSIIHKFNAWKGKMKQSL